MEFKTSSLTMHRLEKNGWLDSLKEYTQCYYRYFHVFNKISDLEKELKREDVNTVCRKELNAMRQAAPDIGYRELHARRTIMYNPVDKYQWQCLSENKDKQT